MLFIPVFLLSAIGILLLPYIDEDRIYGPQKIITPINIRRLDDFISEKRAELNDNPDAALSDAYWDEIKSKLLSISRTELRSGNVKHFFLTGLIILILTNGFLTYIVSRSITRPLGALKNAAERIKNGELDTVLNTTRKDEFREVMTVFEEMRMRLKGSLEQQIQYEENRKELVASISHDLRTPLTAIRGYVEGIKDGVADTSEKMEKYLDTIHAKTILVDHLIDQLSLYSSLDINQVSFHFRGLNIKKFIIDIMDEVVHDFKNLKVTTGPMEDNIFVRADAVHLKRVFFNIIENAVKYNDKDKTEVAISLLPEEKGIVILIEDNGPGIDPAVLPRIFEKFYRADPSRSSDRSGSGLGLAISRQILTAHKGSIQAENRESPATGLRISLYLPT